MNRSVRRGGTALGYGMIGVAGAALRTVFAVAASTVPLAYAGVQLCFFFVGVSYAVGATTLGEVTPIVMMGRVSTVYLLIQTLVGQSLGPLVVALVSKTFFNGPDDIPLALGVSMVGLALVCILSAITLIGKHRSGTLKPTAAIA